jgi:disease resistance protein RPS2
MAACIIIHAAIWPRVYSNRYCRHAAKSNVFCSGGGRTAHFDLLPNLEELYLQDLTYLESISELVCHLGLRFLRLKLIEVTRCSQMKHLLSCGYHIHTLLNLQVIKVSFCDKLDEIFSYHSIQFIAPDPVVSSLRILELKYLPKLKTLYRHETAPHLEPFTVIKCNRLTITLCRSNETADTIDEIREES